MSTISLCMIVKNEEKVLERCLASIADIVDEIIIVDTGSTDQTKEIARRYKGKIFDFTWCDDFSKARNYGLEQATCEYCFVLDADEYLDISSKSTLRKLVEGREKFIGRINRRDSFISNGEEAQSYARISRLMPRGTRYKGAIHEQVQSQLPSREVDILVHHDGYLQDSKVTRNLPILLKELEQMPNDVYLLYQAGKQYRLLRENSVALDYYIRVYNYIGKSTIFRPQVVIDLIHVLKDMKAFDEAIELIENEEENMEGNTDFYFVMGLVCMDICVDVPQHCTHYMPFVEQAYLKCLEIGVKGEEQGVEGTGTYLAAYNLGVYYEVFGDIQKAKEYYSQSERYGYKKARERLNKIK